MSNTLKIIIDYLKFLKPKAHNAIAKLIVITGLALIAPSLLALWYRPEYNRPNKEKQHEWEYQLSP